MTNRRGDRRPGDRGRGRRDGWHQLPALCLVCCLACAPGPSPEPQDPAPAIAQGDTALILGELDAADAAYREALAIAPLDARALHGLARTYLARQAPEGALGVFASLERSDPAYLAGAAHEDHCRALADSTRARLLAGDAQGALSRAHRLGASRCPDPPAGPLLGRALLAEGSRLRGEGDDARALALLLRAAVADPELVEAFALAARVLLADGQGDAAVALLSEALSRHPEDPELQLLMVDALGIR